MAKEKASLEARVDALEVAIEYLTAELAGKMKADIEKDWPRRNCDAKGCKTILRRQSAADLPKFCETHEAAAAAGEIA